MIKEIQYKTFSLRTHKKNWQIKKPNVCQFELTFSCDLHCSYCYSDCYNRPSLLKKELNTEQVKFILDKVYNAGVIWVCFTGGDPLKRKDFLEIYSYAKEKGFIITIFTSGYSMTKDIVDYLKEKPPFVIEITLNAVNKKLYEHISRVKGSFEKAMDGLNMIVERKLPLKIKTMLTKDNLGHLDHVKRFIQGLKVKFRPSSVLYARLDGDLTPCSLRITSQDVSRFNGRDSLNSIEDEEDCRINSQGSKVMDDRLFACAAGGGDGINIDPYGQMHLCNLIREPKIDLLTSSIEEGKDKLLPLARDSKFNTDSKCKYCQIRNLCLNCPGKALLEAGDQETPIEYFCKLAHLVSGRKYSTDKGGEKICQENQNSDQRLGG